MKISKLQIGKGKQGDHITTELSDETLKIHAIKLSDEVISVRINTIEDWKYSYFEARRSYRILTDQTDFHMYTLE